MQHNRPLPALYVMYRCAGPVGLQVAAHCAQKLECPNRVTISHPDRCIRVDLPRTVTHRQSVLTEACHRIDPQSDPYMCTDIPAVYFHLHRCSPFISASVLQRSSVPRVMCSECSAHSPISMSVSCGWCCICGSNRISALLIVFLLLFSN
jgi:hypothetical protein